MLDYYKWQGAALTLTDAGTTYQYLQIDSNQSGVLGNLIFVGGANWIIFQSINAAATGGATTPTLDTTLETSLDGSTWYNILTLTQVTTAAGSGKIAGSRHLLVATAQPILLGDFLRVKHVVTDGGGIPVYAVNNIVMLGN